MTSENLVVTGHEPAYWAKGQRLIVESTGEVIELASDPVSIRSNHWNLVVRRDTEGRLSS